ncbi:lactate utilization protein [Candidatus Sumerlaeota bacterium]|nr:lactate utilization protein [Candidatus Sumerlaeota bacterium]
MPLPKNLSKDLSKYISELKGELARLPGRPRKGELLARAGEIPLIWPEAEFPPGRSDADQFEKTLSFWGAQVHRVGSDAEVVPKVAEVIEEIGARIVSRWHCPRLDVFDWDGGLKHLDLEWIEIDPDQVAAAESFEERKKIRDRLERIEVGITDADRAVAHTGTMLFEHSPERNGFLNLFPWTHIAVLRLSQMVRTIQDLVDLLGREHAGKPWRPNTVFVTGPSRSADIDLTHGQGAAGPGRLHVVLIEDATESSRP